ncbi:hypothetical protein K437DRAFT_256386 [Tilletiaria anomala UBC 951]|uniref:Uncharacterized protein n=1 Tax=Tilletiaria anomala (strain ATCC 24038 / CBS 436.72 / UBC 951) TaxID=1037660 RepID=A0A066W5C2_TILAU|nr:uncharacterized protein K437DRAFT_256386 [Tilletiaria anomala UBC 951]KDN45970.1 hypothetical protein K437DRAFT_256386 [Tilletiaria anomala UBC 951]
MSDKPLWTDTFNETTTRSGQPIILSIEQKAGRQSPGTPTKYVRWSGRILFELPTGLILSLHASTDLQLDSFEPAPGPDNCL